MRQLLLILTVLLLASCALQQRQFVDEDGRPLQGVLVMSSFPGDMLMGGACATASLTDADGYASVASRHDVVAIMPGYHAWVRWGPDDRGRSTVVDEQRATVMHRRTGSDQPVVHDAWHEMRFVTREDEVQSVPLPSEIGVALELVGRTDFRARAQGSQLMQSTRFYFAGPSESCWVSSLAKGDDLFFYVRTPAGRVFKVGVMRSRTGKSWRRLRVGGVTRQVPTETVTVLWADLGGQVRTVEPLVRPVRVPWLGDSTRLVLCDASSAAAALRAAVDRGEVEDGEVVGRWLARLDEAGAAAADGP
ncbi:MAG: hypothetical protein KAI24_15875 [Planctomycetes bacterium]|nr:hypothetical protein [Planctomycetota bacterium]